ncbi:MAG: radical SAM protein [Promethearchaeota archaeon]|nr:MAG: radical SAM protein [Candidatus Lokiarchaeota archaeon]
MVEILRTTTSICPECMQPIPADIFVDPERNWVMMRKTCEKHGEFMDKLSIDPEYYKWKNQHATDLDSLHPTTPLNIPHTPEKKGCPYDCGLCDHHLSAANLMIIDITNRCNLNCPICFANSNAAGRIVEYTYEEIVRIMEHFIQQRPYHAVIAQFSGGEPTLHPRILDILRKAKELGFPHVMLNTNGIKMAKSKDFCQELKEIGLGAIYLSWDASSDNSPEVYEKIRAKDLTEIKEQVIQNCREVGLDGIFLVSTIAKGVNDHEIGPILEYAKANNDIVGGVIFQPVSLCGRITLEDLMNMRYTASDLIAEIKHHTEEKIQKFYPLAMSSKLTQLLVWFSDLPGWSISTHEDCGWATFMPIQNGEWVPMEDLLDVDGFISWSNQCWDMVEKREIPKPSKWLQNLRPFAFTLGIHRAFDALTEFSDSMSDIGYRNAMKLYWGLGAIKFLKNFDLTRLMKDPMYRSILNFINDVRIDKSKQMLQHGLMFVGCMHFQDAYDLDVARVQRCVVHYGVIDPDDPEERRVLQIPFCTFNTIHREKIEAKWAAKHGKPLKAIKPSSE